MSPHFLVKNRKCSTRAFLGDLRAFILFASNHKHSLNKIECAALPKAFIFHNMEKVQMTTITLSQQKNEVLVPGEYRPITQAQPINPAAAYIMSLQSNNSKKTMRSFLEKVAVLLGYSSLMDTPWQELRRHHVQGIISKLTEQELSPSTVNTYLSAIKGVALEAWTSGALSADDYAMIKSVKSLRGKRVRRGKALTQSDVKQFLNIDINLPIGLRNFAIFSLMVACGLRRAEVVSLNVADLDVENGRIIVRGKGNKERVLYVSSGVVASIQNWIQRAGLQLEDPLFTRVLRHNVMTNKRLSPQAIYYFMKEQQERLGLPDISPHDLRRTFATMLLQKGEDLITVMEAMGHNSVETTQTYDMRGEEKLKQAATHFDWL